MKRGEIRFYQFAPPDKRRPVLILTRDAALRHLNDVVVVAITTTIDPSRPKSFSTKPTACRGDARSTAITCN